MREVGGELGAHRRPLALPAREGGVAGTADFNRHDDARARQPRPTLSRFSADAVHVERKVDRFTWSTATANVDLKARNLPIKGDLPPSFAPIVKKWKEGQKS